MSEEEECLVDPITLEPFTNPVVASDGITYDYESIVQVVNDMDNPLRLSPITKEPLRNLVFVSNHLRELLGLPRVPQNQIARQIFKKLKYQDGREGVMKSIHRFNPKDIISDPTIMLLFQKLNLWDKVIVLKVITRQEFDDKWSIFGPRPIAELKNRVLQFVKSIHFDKLFNNPENFGSCNLYVYDTKKKKTILYTTIEHILGSMVADECFEEEEEREEEKEEKERGKEQREMGELESRREEAIKRQAVPKYIGGFGHYHHLKDATANGIVYRDLRCFKINKYGGLIVHRTRPFDLNPFFPSF